MRIVSAVWYWRFNFLTAGETTGASGTGGNLNLTAGQGTRSGGDVFLTGGVKATSSANFESGSVTIKTGALTGTGDIGSITIETEGANTPGSDNTAAGGIFLTTGDGGTRNADGGHLTISLGDINTTGASFTAGSFILTTGDDVASSASGSGGKFTITLGSTVAGTGGAFGLTAGPGGMTGAGGGFTLTLGAGGSTSGNAGNFFITPAAAPVAGTGSSVTITAGLGGTVSGDAGRITLTAQEATGSGTPGLVRVESNARSALLVEGEFQVKTDKGQYAGSYIGTRTNNATTTDVTLTRIHTLAIMATNNRTATVRCTVKGNSTASNDAIVRFIEIEYYRNNAGAISILQTRYNTQTFTGASAATWTTAISVSGNDIFIQVTGANGITVNWTVQSEVQIGGMAA